MHNYKIFSYEKLDSTMQEAKLLQSKVSDDFAVIANIQTNGKGRFDRAWQTNKGDLMFTLSLLIKNIKIDNLSNINFVCCLSIIDAIEDLYNIENMNIKWPNDILVNKKKISGILLEVVNEKINIGIGINIENCPLNVLYPADFLKNHNNMVDKNILFEKILNNINEYINYINHYGVEISLSRWKEKIYGMGKVIYIRKMDEFISGIFVDINNKGNLLVEINNEIEELSAGDIFFE